jgi:hypothetical protein
MPAFLPTARHSRGGDYRVVLTLRYVGVIGVEVFIDLVVYGSWRW